MSPLTSLASICRDNVLREKILVVPSLAIGHQIADAVAQGGTPWVNLRAETVRTIADAIAGFDLAQEGLTVLSRAQALAIVERVCDDVLDDASYFGALKDRPGLHRAIQRSVDDLRHAGLKPAGIPGSAFEDPHKADDLARILEAYERELTGGRFVDRFGVLARAIRLLENGAAKPWPPDTLWIVADELELTNAEERLLSLASGDALQKLTPEETPPDDVSFRRAAGEENELRSAFRSILDEAVPFDSAEIVYTTREPYLPLAFELAAEHEVPCTFAEGIASHFTRPGQAVLGFFSWIADGWNAAHLQRIARSGAIAFGSELAIKPWTFARVMRKAGIGWGRDRHLSRVRKKGPGLRLSAISPKAPRTRHLHHAGKATLRANSRTTKSTEPSIAPPNARQNSTPCRRFARHFQAGVASRSGGAYSEAAEARRAGTDASHHQPRQRTEDNLSRQCRLHQVSSTARGDRPAFRLDRPCLKIPKYRDGSPNPEAHVSMFD
jgi:hypothetical protein